MCDIMLCTYLAFISRTYGLKTIISSHVLSCIILCRVRVSSLVALPIDYRCYTVYWIFYDIIT